MACHTCKSWRQLFPSTQQGKKNKIWNNSVTSHRNTVETNYWAHLLVLLVLLEKRITQHHCSPLTVCTNVTFSKGLKWALLSTQHHPELPHLETGNRSSQQPESALQGCSGQLQEGISSLPVPSSAISLGEESPIHQVNTETLLEHVITKQSWRNKRNFCL